MIEGKGRRARDGRARYRRARDRRQDIEVKR